MHRIDGPGATVDNKFTEGDPVGGIQATVVTDDFLNDVQEELISVLAAAGVTPVKGTQDQVLQAIYKLAQSQKATAFTAAGTATALTLTPTPAISAYAANQRFTVKFPVSSGLNPTLNVSAKGAKSLKQYDSSGAKVSAQFSADQVGDVLYDGVDFVLLDQLPVAQTVRQGVRGAASNYKAFANGSSGNIAITADRVTLEDAAGNCVTVSNVNLTLNTLVAASATVSGMATGATVAGGVYGKYIWYNKTTGALIATGDSSLSAPTSPAAGFDFWARRGTFRCDQTANRFPLAFLQDGSDCQYKPQASGNVLRFPAMSTGASIGNSTIAGGAVAVSTLGVAPNTASHIRLNFTQTGTGSANAIIVPSNNYGIDGSPTAPPIGLTITGEQGQQPPIEFMLESRDIFISCGSAYTLSCIGWRDSL